MQLTGGTPAKSASAAPVISSQASTPANRAASLAFLMCLDHSAAILHAKSTGTPKGDSSPKVTRAPPTPSAPASNNEHPVAPQQVSKTIPAQALTPIALNQLLIATEIAKAATRRIVLQPSSAAAAAASAIKGATVAVQPSKVRQRSEEGDSVKSASPSSQLIGTGRPQRSSLMGPEPKKQKSSRCGHTTQHFVSVILYIRIACVGYLNNINDYMN